MTQYFIVKVESFEGESTFLRCGTEDQDFLFAVLSVDVQGNAEIVDSGYRSYEEAAASWPEAGASARVGK